MRIKLTQFIGDMIYETRGNEAQITQFRGLLGESKDITKDWRCFNEWMGAKT